MSQNTKCKYCPESLVSFCDGCRDTICSKCLIDVYREGLFCKDCVERKVSITITYYENKSGNSKCKYCPETLITFCDDCRNTVCSKCLINTGDGSLCKACVSARDYNLKGISVIMKTITV